MTSNHVARILAIITMNRGLEKSEIMKKMTFGGNLSMMKAKVLKFTAVFEKAEEGGYIVRVPALPGCMTQGETFEKAEQMAKDAIRAYCASLKKHKEPIPIEGPQIIESLSVAISA